ncbi:MAG TPA: hypothetical protein VMG10_06015 [Gemmataceae bacterium]|nr:hypothetical protein [Gemmataceae bacterium]
MFHRLLMLGEGLVVCAVALLITSSAQAQTSPSGHVPARTTYGSVAPPPFSIYPGDRMFQATMKIQHAYQYAERVAPLMAYRPPSWSTTVQESAGPVEVGVTSPEGIIEMVTIRGPDGKLRSFPILGGRKAIKARTIVVHPGQSLNLAIRGGRVEVSRK